MAPRKIEVGCQAIVRATGIPVQPIKLYRGYRGLPNTFACSNGCEYQARELRRVDGVKFVRAELQRDYLLYVG